MQKDEENDGDADDLGASSSADLETELSSSERRARSAKYIMDYTGATMKEVNELREMFELVDQDKGGSIDGDELKKLTELLNMDTSRQELDDMMSEIDTTGTGEIFFPDFVRCMLKKPEVAYTASSVCSAFATLASKSSVPCDPGKIPYSLLMHQLTSAGLPPSERLSKDRADDILSVCEVDKSGMVNYGEFVTLMMGDKQKQHEGGDSNAHRLDAAGDGTGGMS